MYLFWVQLYARDIKEHGSTFLINSIHFSNYSFFWGRKMETEYANGRIREFGIESSEGLDIGEEVKYRLRTTNSRVWRFLIKKNGREVPCLWKDAYTYERIRIV